MMQLVGPAGNHLAKKKEKEEKAVAKGKKREYITDMDNALTYLNTLRPALPWSVEKPCKVASNGELRRWMQSNAVLINGQPVKWDTPIDFEVVSLVFFPKSENRRTTLL